MDQAWPGARHSLTRFIGRGTETAALLQQLRDTRLVTLVGAPGTGKTRLAAEASHSAGSFRDGVRPVALATVSEPGDVLTELAASLDVRAAEDTLVDALLEALRSQESLVLLDNCEHVVGPVAALVERILTSCPGVRVLATSRVPLGVPGERLHRVPALDRTDAYDLFVDRAALVTDLVLDEDGTAWVRRICDRLDGLPLAIELAARQARVLSLPDLAERLDTELARAAAPGNSPDAPTMAATIEWSCHLLTPAQNGLFETLSVFAGSFDVQAVEAVSGGGEDLVADLGVVVDHSLLLAEPSTSGALRYRMLEPIRQYAAARLAGRGAAEESRERHAQHYLRAARTASAGLMGVDGHLRHGELRGMEANVLAAVAWARPVCPDLALHLLVCLAEYWEQRGHIREARTRLEDLLHQGSVSPRARADTLLSLAQLCYRQERYEQACRYGQDLIPIMEELGDRPGLANGLRALSQAHAAAGQVDRARAAAEASVEIFDELGDRLGEARARTALGFAHYAGGQVEQGLEANLVSWQILQSEPEAPTVARGTHMGLCFAYANLDDVEGHRRHLTATIAALRQIGALDGDPEWLWAGVALAHSEGRWASSVKLAALTRTRARAGSGMVPFVREFCQPATEEAERRLGPRVAEALAEEGARMTVEEAVGEALGRPSPDAFPLTPREREVARLTGRGMSNTEIAEELVISRRTVESHQDHIRHKLGLASRYEVMVWAMTGSV